MSEFPHNPQNPHVSPTVRTRVKWDNIAILAAGFALAAAAVTIIMSGPNQQAATSAANEAAPTTSAPAVPESDLATSAENTLTMQEAVGLVEEATGYIGEGRWEEAADRLSMIPETLRETSGALAAQTTLEDNQRRWNTLNAAALRAATDKNWELTLEHIEALEAIAPLDAELGELKSGAETALAEEDEQLAKQEAAAEKKRKAEAKKAADAKKAAAKKRAEAEKQAAAAIATATGGGATKAGGANKASGTSDAAAAKNSSSTATGNAAASTAAASSATAPQTGGDIISETIADAEIEQLLAAN